MPTGPLNRFRTSSPPLPSSAFSARRFLITLNAAPSLRRRPRRSVISATVRPRLWATTTAPAPSNTPLSVSIDSAFCARSIAVSDSQIDAGTIPDAGWPDARGIAPGHGEPIVLSEGSDVRRPPEAGGGIVASPSPHGAQGLLRVYDPGGPRIPKFSDRDRPERTRGEKRRSIHERAGKSN